VSAPASTSAPEAEAAPSPESEIRQSADFDATIPDPPAYQDVGESSFHAAGVGASSTDPAADAQEDLEATAPGLPTPEPSRETDFAATVIARAMPAVLDGDLDATIIGPVIAMGSASADRAAPRPTRIRVVDATGMVEHELSGVIYVGRAPELPVEADRRRSSLVAVVSVGDDVAHTHAQLTAGDGLVLVRDLWSVSGTRIEQPHGGLFQLLPGEQIPIARGSRILLGDGVILETVG
jgi:hypothetical protein